jgi:excisionase family DNA binding protein
MTNDIISTLYNSTFADFPDVVSVEQMAEMLKISTKTAYALLRNGDIECLKVGRSYRIPKYFIMKYLNLIHD